METIQPRTQALATKVFIVAAAVCFSMLSIEAAAGVASYGGSAHGDGSTGVYREGANHTQGDCAHCHDTFDDTICQNPLMLFAANNPTSQTDNFCFQCHSGNGTYCYHAPGSGATATWRPNIHTTANYKVYARWSAGPDRATDAPFTIYYYDVTIQDDCYPMVISTETVRVNQQINGGQWNYLGTYAFAAGTSCYVVLSNDADGNVIADAVGWQFDSWTPCYDPYGTPPSYQLVADNLSAEFVGNWTCLSDTGAYPDGGTSVQLGGIVNNDYGATFGGGVPQFDSIYDAFNPFGTYASSHDLATVQDFAKNSAWGSWVTDGTNACLVCHEQHLSQKNFPVVINGDGGVNTAFRRGNDVVNYPGDLWGDEPLSESGRPEMMSDETTGYQAPLRGDAGHEPGPAGSNVEGGSNLPNFVSACTEACHSQAINGREAVNWAMSKHGEGMADNAPGDWGWLKAPYSEGSRGSYVLACTDCHEPHGSDNPTLLRSTVNGVSGLFSTGAAGSVYPGGAKWYYWCQACHDLTYNPETGEGHPVTYANASCGDSVGCHMSSNDGSGGNHSDRF
jgi:hypothetical protein